MHKQQSDISAAAVETFVRSVLPGALWLARVVAGWLSDPPAACLIGLDLLLVGSHLWANRPLRRAMGPRFGWRSSYSALPYTACLAALFVLALDAWAGLR